MIYDDDMFDGDSVKHCPCCGEHLADVEVLSGGIVDFYCGECGRSGDISIDVPL